jgi:hypothetical protein
VIRGKGTVRTSKPSPNQELSPIIQELFQRSEGNVVRVQEILQDEYGQKVSYSTLTRIVRSLDLREDKKNAVPEPMSLGRARKCNTIPPLIRCF